MKSLKLIACGAMMLLLASCGTTGIQGVGPQTGGSVLGDVLGAATNGETLGNILSSVIGTNKLSQRQLIGTWRYDGPGAAFTSKNALAKAGGEIAATEVEQKLQKEYKRLGFTSRNTYVTFNQNGTFSAKIDGHSWSGQYTYDEKSGKVNFRGLLLNVNAYAQRNGSGISLLFESKKILNLFQIVASASGSSTLSTIGNISKNYDGVRIGFDMKK